MSFRPNLFQVVLWALLAILAIFLSKGIFSHSQRKVSSGPFEKSAVVGTVTYVDLEGGFFGILSETGEHFDPINLPEAFQKDGLKVRFWYEEQKSAVGIHMWGRIIKIQKIEKK